MAEESYELESHEHKRARELKRDQEGAIRVLEENGGECSIERLLSDFAKTARDKKATKRERVNAATAFRIIRRMRASLNTIARLTREGE